MIIECIKCSKKFNVNDELIPENGRQIQCGSCYHKWHYKLEKIVEKAPIIKTNNITQQETRKKNNEKFLDNSIESDENKEENKIKKNQNIKNKSRNAKTNSFFSYLLVSIISFIALIIVLDTFKSPLINIFPNLEIILFNLFETLKDVKLFIIDLT